MADTNTLRPRVGITAELVTIDRGVDQASGRDLTVAHLRIRLDGLLHPAHTCYVAIEGIDERARQDVRWGESNHPDLPAGVAHPCAWFGIPSADAARRRCEDAFRRGIGSLAHILLEEVSEAIEVAGDPEKLRAELVQAVAIKWIETIDRRQEVPHD
jgi:hypothetical protein